MTPALSALLKEMDIKAIPTAKWRTMMETCAVATLERILQRHGPEHLRSVLLSIVETENNRRNLVSPVIWAVSDVLLAHPLWFGSAWLDALDKINLAEMHERARANRRAAQPRQAIATMLFEKLREVFQAKEIPVN